MWTSTWMHWVLLVDRTRWPTPAWTSCSKSPLHLLLQPVSSRLQFILSLSAWLTRLQLRLHDWETMKMILFARTHTQSWVLTNTHMQAHAGMHAHTPQDTFSLSLSLSLSASLSVFSFTPNLFRNVLTCVYQKIWLICWLSPGRVGSKSTRLLTLS